MIKSKNQTIKKNVHFWMAAIVHIIKKIGIHDVTASRPSQKTPLPKGELGRLRIW
jgi:hypothetical protein